MTRAARWPSPTLRAPRALLAPRWRLRSALLSASRGRWSGLRWWSGPAGIVWLTAICASGGLAPLGSSPAAGATLTTVPALTLVRWRVERVLVTRWAPLGGEGAHPPPLRVAAGVSFVTPEALSARRGVDTQNFGERGVGGSAPAALLTHRRVARILERVHSGGGAPGAPMRAPRGQGAQGVWIRAEPEPSTRRLRAHDGAEGPAGTRAATVEVPRRTLISRGPSDELTPTTPARARLTRGRDLSLGLARRDDVPEAPARARPISNPRRFNDQVVKAPRAFFPRAALRSAEVIPRPSVTPTRRAPSISTHTARTQRPGVKTVEPTRSPARLTRARDIPVAFSRALITLRPDAQAVARTSARALFTREGATSTPGAFDDLSRAPIALIRGERATPATQGRAIVIRRPAEKADGQRPALVNLSGASRTDGAGAPRTQGLRGPLYRRVEPAALAPSAPRRVEPRRAATTSAPRRAAGTDPAHISQPPSPQRLRSERSVGRPVARALSDAGLGVPPQGEISLTRQEMNRLRARGSSVKTKQQPAERLDEPAQGVRPVTPRSTRWPTPALTALRLVQATLGALARALGSRGAAARPDVARPDVAQSDVARPDVARPDVAHVAASPIVINRPAVARPAVARSDAPRPVMGSPVMAPTVVGSMPLVRAARTPGAEPRWSTPPQPAAPRAPRIQRSSDTPRRLTTRPSPAQAPTQAPIQATARTSVTRGGLSPELQELLLGASSHPPRPSPPAPPPPLEQELLHTLKALTRRDHTAAELLQDIERQLKALRRLDMLRRI